MRSRHTELAWSCDQLKVHRPDKSKSVVRGTETCYKDGHGVNFHRCRIIRRAKRKLPTVHSYDAIVHSYDSIVHSYQVTVQYLCRSNL